MKCASSKAHWPTHADAARRLAQINTAPDPTRLYQPTRVSVCHCGGYVLTSKSGKPHAKGKSARRRPTKGSRR